MKSCCKVFCLLLAGLACTTLRATTWYVRRDGGTRYSVNAPTGQCDGKADVAYAGKGANEHCAFNDIRYLWTDGTYTVDINAGSPKWGWIGSGGDTYVIRDGPWRIGQSGPNPKDYFGLAGNPFGAGAPPPLSGTPGTHTKILGANFASCRNTSAKTQLYGGYGVGNVLSLSGASYLDVACFDITDHSDCGKAGQLKGCATDFPIGDYASNGIGLSITSTHDKLTDIHIHGLASAGIIGPTGDGVEMDFVDLIGNASSGWNADAGDGKTGTGTLSVSHFNISWNGCVEEYPIVHALPYQDCTDDNIGGYGDGFGTATVVSNPGWQAHFDQGVVSYNTQDGLDALHLHGAGSSMTITNVLAYGNMGQQIKVGGAHGTATNNRIVTNCNALRQSIPETPAGYNNRLSDFCRASDTGIAMTVGKGTTLTYTANILFSASSTGIEIDCDPTAGACDSTSRIDFRDNVFVGFKNSKANGYPSGGTGAYSNPIYNGTLPFVDFFLNVGSVYSHNVTYHPNPSWSCPAKGETKAICGDPHLVDESWHIYGFGDMAPASGAGASAASSEPPADAKGDGKTNYPTAKALESISAGVLVAALGFGIWHTQARPR